MTGIRGTGAHRIVSLDADDIDTALAELGRFQEAIEAGDL